MTDVAGIEKLLNELKDDDEIINATVVSRSGMHIAGSTPQGVHVETFVAMSAILLGAAETATSELKEDLKSVIVNLKETKLIVKNAGAKALLVLQVAGDAHLKDLFEKLVTVTAKIDTSVD